MAGPDSHSWSRVVDDSNAAAVFNNGKQEFRWKTAKKGRIRPSAPRPTEKCHEEHCRTVLGRCMKRDCIARIDRQLSLIKAENATLDAEFTKRLENIHELEREILRNCNMDEYYSSENHESTMARFATRLASVPGALCSCVSCELAYEQKVSSDWNDKLSAAQLRLEVLRDYRVAHEEEAVEWKMPHSNRSTRYFTPVGTAKGRGVSALRPTLQMQNSYDVEALTTNSMIARPLEIAKEGKPKQSAFGQTKASLKDGDNNEDNSGGWCTVEKRK